MTFENNHRRAFVWIWLPDKTSPVVAGKLEKHNDQMLFNYGKSYLERVSNSTPSLSIYEPELPLKSGILPLQPGLPMPSSIRDAAPDAWGRRVIMNRMLGLKGSDVDIAQLNELCYLLESGSDRIGALDFQHSSVEYQPRSKESSTLEELLESTKRVEQGVPLTSALDEALLHGSSIGGARPKALIEDREKKYIAKFSSQSDLYNVVKAEFIAMRLAAIVGLDVAPVELTKVVNKDVLLIERFDRIKTKKGWARKAMVSSLTLFGLDEMMARYASYEVFAEIIRHRFVCPEKTLKELFSRLVFNILCGNTDDHARNHSAFWNGKHLSFTPAYDICPQGRSGHEASQAMLIFGQNNLSQLKTCLKVAHCFLLSEKEAHRIFDKQITLIKQYWDEVCDEAQMNIVDRNLLWKRDFLNPYALEI